jgi:AMP nucleosidase
MISAGVKTSDSDKLVTLEYIDMHIQAGIDSLLEIKNNGLSVKHLKF